MKRKIIILTGYNRFFGQTRKPWVSLNTEMLISRLKSMSIEVDEHPFHQVANSLIEVKNSIVFYTFSQKENLRGYIRDAMFALINNGNTIIPSYKLLLCHENKGYQEHLKKELGITNLPAWYFSSQSDLTDYNLEFPLVLKTLEGSNGKGVFLVKSETHLVELLNKINGSLSLAQKADLIRRRYLRLPKKFHGYSDFDIKKDYKEYRDYIKPEKGFILQKFIPGLEYDYRITVLGDKYYVTRRLNRKGDFRASGAKF
jgi:glutathione synthase/RimK-type ligase-like ATP-grasp enzyme